MQTCCYWRIEYGPEAFEEETECVADIIDKALERLKREGFVLDASVFILKSEDPNGVFTQYSADPDDWEDVVALVKVADETTKWNLRMCLTSGNTKHTSLFTDSCRYEPLQQAQFEQLTIEYESKRR